jgi:hypothetical protein
MLRFSKNFELYFHACSPIILDRAVPIIHITGLVIFFVCKKWTRTHTYAKDFDKQSHITDRRVSKVLWDAIGPSVSLGVIGRMDALQPGSRSETRPREPVSVALGW